MTENNNTPATFIVDDWVGLYDGNKFNRKVQIIAVNGDEVTVRIMSRQLVFKVRPSDGKMVKVGSHDRKNPMTLAHMPVKKKTSWKDVRDFLHGMFWAP